MYNCEICGNKADIHHIIHRSEGGFDIEINYKYLCALHHRGKNGPHQNQFVDLQYKVDMQTKLYSILPKEYYSPKEISQILGIHNNSLKRLLKNLKRYKEGYKKDDILAIAVYSPLEKLVPPCGACCQVMNELLNKDTPVLMVYGKDLNTKEVKVKDLLPYSFSGENLNV